MRHIELTALSFGIWMDLYGHAMLCASFHNVFAWLEIQSLKTLNSETHLDSAQLAGVSVTTP
jgi:hypothetical protein